jgi:hypothetical protein
MVAARTAAPALTGADGEDSAKAERDNSGRRDCKGRSFHLFSPD